MTGGVLGPFTYGKGTRYIDHSATSNRSLCVKFLKIQNMLEVASYKTPNPIQHITFKDKAAPPSTWAQFVLDPLVLQQFYDLLHFKMESKSLEVAALVRSFLMEDQLLPPHKSNPEPDPVRFQRLDHTFTRKQWLSSINSCTSKLHTGFPSDHYLLVTEIQVRLAKRVRPNPPQPKFNLNKVTPKQRYEFNHKILQHLGREPLADHSATHEQGGLVHIFTDGSGSSGRCSSKTPAGWGWCYRIEDGWKEAYGPVVTNPDTAGYQGAGVGSNNTGEVTAIIEAVLYSQQQQLQTVIIHTDSTWAKNVITGVWRPQKHKLLVNRARDIIRAGNTKVVLEWIKGYSGNEGNERADELANKGRATQRHYGGADHSATHVHRATEEAITHTDLVTAIKLAADSTFPKQAIASRRPWITQPTLDALADAHKAEADGEPDAKKLRNKAKRLARKDRVTWVHNQLQNEHAQTIWTVARSQKRGFVGKKQHLVVDGKPVPWSQTHVAFWRHLESVQWTCRERPDHSAATLEARALL